MLRSRLPEIAADLPDAYDRAVKAGAELVAVAAKARVPFETGRLQRAIHVEKTRRGIAVVAGDREAFYGHFVEFGHHGKSGNVGPQPFLIPALEESRLALEAEITAAIRRVT